MRGYKGAGAFQIAIQVTHGAQSGRLLNEFGGDAGFSLADFDARLVSGLDLLLSSHKLTESFM